MSFDNLTPAWTDQPLTNPGVAADVVDLVLSLGDRQRGTFAVVLCDPDDHYRATVLIDLPSEFDHLSPVVDAAEVCTTALKPIIAAVDTAPDTGVILALGRPGHANLPDLDAEWTKAATTICTTANIRLLGFYIATKEGVHHPNSLAAA
ncbi:hypothetical protein [Kribbella kalugense]|nr:hypothetical protein [Kribbella kalugense]